MNIKNFLLNSSLLIIFCSSMTAQELTEKQKEYEKNKVQIFTVEERDNIQHWIQKEFQQMNLSEDLENEYTTILLFYWGKIQRLDDKDMGNSKEEILTKIDEYRTSQDRELEKILSPEEYAKHLEIYDRLMLSVKTRIKETDFEQIDK